MEDIAKAYLQDAYQDVSEDEADAIISLAGDIDLKKDGTLTAKAKKALDDALVDVFSSDDIVETKDGGVKVKKLLDGDFYIGAHKIVDVVPEEVLNDNTMKAKFDNAIKLGVIEKV